MACISWIIDVIKGMAKPEYQEFEAKEKLDHSAFLQRWKQAGRPQVHRLTSLGWLDSVTYRLSFDDGGRTCETSLDSAAGVTPDAEPELLEIWGKAVSDNK